MSRSTTGSVFRRDGGKNYYVRFTFKGKRYVWVLKDEEGNKIVDKRLAEKAKHRIVAPYLARDEEQLRQQAVDALKAAKEKRKDAERALLPTITPNDSWQHYINSSERPDSGDRTLVDYRGYWNRFVEWLNKNNPEISKLDEISPSIGKSYADHLAKRGLSPNSFNKNINLLKLVFNVLANDANITVNPFGTIRRKRLTTNSRRELTREELDRVLRNAPDNIALLLGLGTFTGMRLGDCCTLQWGEIEMAKGIIRKIPNKSLGRSDAPKPVVIGIPKVLFQRLNDIPREKRTGYVLPELADKYLYTNKSGTHSRRGDITKMIQEHFVDCGIRIHRPGTGFNLVKQPDGSFEKVPTGKRAIVEVGFHSLRHTYVSLHAEQGTPQAVIQATVGHGNPAMTRHYTHISEDVARSHAELFVVKSEDPEIYDLEGTRKRLAEQAAIKLDEIRTLVEKGGDPLHVLHQIDLILGSDFRNLSPKLLE